MQIIKSEQYLPKPSLWCFPRERSMPVTAEGAEQSGSQHGSLKAFKTRPSRGHFPSPAARFPPKPISNISTSHHPLPEPSCSLDGTRWAVRAPFLRATRDPPCHVTFHPFSCCVCVRRCLQISSLCRPPFVALTLKACVLLSLEQLKAKNRTEISTLSPRLWDYYNPKITM